MEITTTLDQIAASYGIETANRVAAISSQGVKRTSIFSGFAMLEPMFWLFFANVIGTITAACVYNLLTCGCIVR